MALLAEIVREDMPKRECEEGPVKLILGKPPRYGIRLDEIPVVVKAYHKPASNLQEEAASRGFMEDRVVAGLRRGVGRARKDAMFLGWGSKTKSMVKF
jgi:hypothetical protein